MKTYIILAILYSMFLYGCATYRKPECISLNGSAYALTPPTAEETNKRNITVKCMGE